MLHQDGSRAAWLDGEPGLDLIVTMDDATSTIYWAFLVEEEGTASTFRALCARSVWCARGLPSSFYTDRGSHYLFTPKAARRWTRTASPRSAGAGAARDRAHPGLFAQGGALRADVRHAEDRLPKELITGIEEVEAANRFIREVYLPAHNARFARPAAIAESAIVSVRDPAGLARHSLRRGGEGRRPRQHPCLCGLEVSCRKPVARPLRQSPRQGARLSGGYGSPCSMDPVCGALRRHWRNCGDRLTLRVIRFDAQFQALVDLWTAAARLPTRATNQQQKQTKTDK